MERVDAQGPNFSPPFLGSYSWISLLSFLPILILNIGLAAIFICWFTLSKVSDGFFSLFIIIFFLVSYDERERNHWNFEG